MELRKFTKDDWNKFAATRSPDPRIVEVDQTAAQYTLIADLNGLNIHKFVDGKHVGWWHHECHQGLAEAILFAMKANICITSQCDVYGLEWTSV